MASRPPPRTANLWAARIIPLVIFGILGFSSWVVIGELCVKYLLKPPSLYNVSRRPGTAAAILVIYPILLVTLLVLYIRILQIIATNPGYLPKGAGAEEQRGDYTGEEQRVRRSCVVTTLPEGRDQGRLDEKASLGGSVSSDDHDYVLRAMLTGAKRPPPGLEQFYSQNAYTCDYRGIPIYCAKCRIWKLDRTHHCSEIDQCVRRMDHFCPWVGGIVSETNMKHFILFVAGTACFTTFVLIIMAYFTHERRRTIGDINGTWVAAIALAAMFFLFTFGMTASTVQMTLNNLTTVENLSKGYKTYYVAVRINAQKHTSSLSQDAGASADYRPSPSFNCITFSKQPDLPPLLDPPLRPSEYAPVSKQATNTLPQDATLQQPTSYTPNSPEYIDGRTFAVLQAPPGDHLWDLGPYRNWKSVMGEGFFQWFSPFTCSPHCHHNGEEGEFEFGPVLERLKAEAGLGPPALQPETLHRRRRRRRRHPRPINDLPLKQTSVGAATRL